VTVASTSCVEINHHIRDESVKHPNPYKVTWIYATFIDDQ